MYIRLLRLEILNFLRNPQFATNLAMKILMAFGMLYFGLVYLSTPFILYFYATKEMQADPLVLFCQFFFFYWVLDLAVRYFMQQMPTQNMKPFLTLNLSKTFLVRYTIFKTFTHFFNWGYLLFLLPFAGLLIFEGEYSILGTLGFTIGILFMFYFSNFLNILLNGKTSILVATVAIVAILGALEYFHIFSVLAISQDVFYSLYIHPWLCLIPILLALGAAYWAYQTIKKTFYLDQALELKVAEGKTENIKFLNRFGVTGTFINNDVKLLKRSKAARSAALMGFVFLFYGLLFFNSAYETDFMKLSAAIFVTGGFMFMFGQRVPSWDSSYYPLMMTLNVPYKQYLKGKWALLVTGTFVSLLLSFFYLFFGFDLWLIIFGAGLYNLGVNCHVTLLAGAYNKKPLDLNSSSKSFGGGNNFNLKTLLLIIPQMILPMAVYALMNHFFNQYLAVAALGGLGFLGLLLRDKIFDLIVSVYKKEKYTTLVAFKKAG